MLRHGFDSVIFCSVRLCSPICYFIWFDYIILCFGILYYIPLDGEIPYKENPLYRDIPYKGKSLVKGLVVKGSLIHGNPFIKETPCKGKPLAYTEKYLYMEIPYKEIP